MSDGGKGSKPRPFSVAHEEYSKRWDAIFGRDLEDETVEKETYQDILSTEDCVIEALEKYENKSQRS